VLRRLDDPPRTRPAMYVCAVGTDEIRKRTEDTERSDCDEKLHFSTSVHG